MPNQLLLLIAIFLPFASCPLLALAGRLKGKTGWLALIFPIISTICIITVASRIGWGQSHVFELEWIPSLGINLSFLFDGLSTLFGLIVSIMGIIITFYARFYLGETYEYQNRFYAYLMLFMAAMLGTVFANNLMLLFVFWELTGLASYFLIGFSHDKEKARLGARQALLVTSITGLLMLVGVVLTVLNTGTYDIYELISKPNLYSANFSWMNIALLFFMLGAFGKSAQFPFHFWLPNAMAAPTPVSAYLHSATMVKLGIFLCARLYPFFVTTELWAPLLITIAFITMVIGSLFALLSNDLKALLAWSTVSQLGYIIGIYGMGTIMGVNHDYFHILNHVFYKGSLFMIAGIVEHATGTRDIRKLGGLFKYMPITAIACIIAAFGMAGIPGTTGFISKELMLTNIFQTVSSHGGGIYWLLPIGMSITAISMIAFSIRLVKNVFFGKLNNEIQSIQKPSFLFQLPACLPTIFVLLFGLFPNILGDALTKLSVTGLQATTQSHLVILHGINIPLIWSLSLILLGIFLYIFGQKKSWSFTKIPTFLRFDDYFEQFYTSMMNHSKSFTYFLRSHKPFDYLPIVISTTVLIIGGYLIYQFQWLKNISFSSFNKPNFIQLLTFAIIVMGTIGTVRFERWIRKLISLSVTGFMITFYFVLYRAPDLALTQILIETVSLILILLLLTCIPKSQDIQNQRVKITKSRKLLTVIVSLFIGIITTSLILLVTAAPNPNPIGNYFIKNTVALAQGNNAVNTILVDFRGYDTMGEITVLVIAMLGVLGLLMRKKRENHSPSSNVHRQES